MKRFFVSASLLLAMGAQAQTLVKQNTLAKGQTFTKTAKSVINNNMEMMGQKVNTDITNGNTTTYTVDAVDANGAKITAQMKKLSMNLDAMGQNMSYDSDKPDESNPMAAPMKSILGAVTKLQVNNAGIITDLKIEGDSSAMTIMESMSGGMSSGPEKGKAIDFVLPLSKNEVKVGETWADSTGNEDNKTVNYYTLTSVINGTALVSQKSTMALKKTANQQGMDVTTNLAGTANGMLEVDAKTLVIRKRKLAMDFKGTIEVMGMNSPMTMKAEVEETVQQ
ncbi:MAG: hypothetical protein EAZ47_06705 [Bacteroidetes bacterium]|nr:MAG: hypothetical protein EAY72_07545 [Bacteroidota bacterium]TAE66856.1 MAG: hypothetical protein EAY68_05790 [Bacteroidota bacterium]TAF93367.1 MAG: hypothetical protein EAZ47_06705 [Bacteroidota bacterium]